MRCFLIQVVIRPVRLLIDIPSFVVELRIEQYQPRQLGRPLGRIVGDEAAAEARPQQADLACASPLPEMRQGNLDVVQVRGQYALFLATFALTVPAEVVTQAGHTSLTQPVRQSREETTFLTSDPATVDQDHRQVRGSVRINERADKVEAVERMEAGGRTLGGHAGSCRQPLAYPCCHLNPHPSSTQTDIPRRPTVADRVALGVS